MIMIDKVTIKAAEVFSLSPDNGFDMDIPKSANTFLKNSLSFMKQLAVRVQAEKAAPAFFYLQEGPNSLIARRLKNESWVVSYHDEPVNPFKINSLLSIHV